MELKDFIRTTLVEIAIGIHEASIQAKELVAIAPGNVNGSPVEQLEKIEFDIAVTVAEDSSKAMESGGNVGGQLKVVGVQFGGSIKESDKSSAATRKEEVSRIKFSVPVILNADFRNDSGFAARESATQESIAKINAARK